MTRNEIYERLNKVFEDVLFVEVDLKDETTANDVEGWDSLAHISLLAAVEDEFGFKFKMKEVVGLKNVGEMVDIIEKEGK